MAIDFIDIIKDIRGIDSNLNTAGNADNADLPVSREDGGLWQRAKDIHVDIKSIKTEINTNTTAAIESAEAALQSELNAAASASSVSLSEANALASANAAKLSEDNALISETNAAASEDSVATNAGIASDAAITSTEQAALATSMADATLVSEDNSALSAANALVSENNAKDSETNASTSETIALAQATVATTKATEASASASAALLSETNAKDSELATATSEANAAAYLNEIEVIYDNFDDRYLGSHATDPLLDNDGNPLQIGAIYFNTTSNHAKFYNGGAWENPELSATQSASQALSSANDAANSETNAAISESNALVSETNAAASEANASTSETNAANSESSSASSEANAALSASEASISETNATTSADAAAASVLAADSSATSAAISESNALVSETNAAISATNAATSEGNAATYEAGAEAFNIAIQDMSEELHNRYLGSLESDPTTDTYGNPVTPGSLYFNSADNLMKVYDGTIWFAAYVSLDGALVKADNLSDLDDIIVARQNLGVEIGVDVQAYDSAYNTYTTAEKDKLDSIVVDSSEVVKYPLVKNTTGDTIYKGTPVMAAGTDGTYTLIVPAIADNSIPPIYYAGLVTEDILDGDTGNVTFFGNILDVDTSLYPYGTILYVSPTVAGELTATKPQSPDSAIYCAIVTHSDSLVGRLFVRHETISNANEVSYDNTVSELIASNIQSAVDELMASKADRSELSSNITLYPTTVAGDFGYNRMVTNQDDPDYDTVAVDVPTGAITGNAQLIAGLIADADLFTGSIDTISLPTIGNIAKIVGNSQQYAEFYFEVYQRDSIGTETLLGTSGTTGSINPSTSDYFQFSATCSVDGAAWVETDRVVIKYYANLTGNAAPEYQFQFGGETPIRTEVPVPASVLIVTEASEILVDSSGFNGVLSGTDSTVQTALETIDNLDALPDQIGAANQYLKSNGTIANWAPITGSDVAVTPHGNLSSNTVQLALEEHQSDIDNIGVYNDYIAAFIIAEA